jgi:hypothetical protein
MKSLSSNKFHVSFLEIQSNADVKILNPQSIGKKSVAAQLSNFFLDMAAATEQPSVTRFRDYLRVKSVQPNPDYAGCLAFLRRQAEEMKLPLGVVEVRLVYRLVNASALPESPLFG